VADTYLRGSTFLKYLDVLRSGGSVPSYPADYTIPTYSVYHQNGSFETLVLDAPLTQGLDNIWYFKYTIPDNANLGDYLIKYKISIDGVPAEITEDFIISVGTNQPPQPSAGEFPITDNVESDALDDLSGVSIFVFLPTDTANAIQSTTSITNGQFTLYLDPGTYIVLFHKEGYISEQHGLVVNNDGTFMFDGN
jgi:hypothetical protein